jgi:hypothetical protein
MTESPAQIAHTARAVRFVLGLAFLPLIGWAAPPAVLFGAFAPHGPGASFSSTLLWVSAYAYAISGVALVINLLLDARYTRYFLGAWFGASTLGLVSLQFLPGQYGGRTLGVLSGLVLGLVGWLVDRSTRRDAA